MNSVTQVCRINQGAGNPEALQYINRSILDPAEKIWAELRASGIADEMIGANFQRMEGQAAVDVMCPDREWKRRNDGRLTDSELRKYYAFADGGWYCSAGEGSQWGCFKADKPRIFWDKEKQREKTIKYEHPAGMPTEIFKLRVTRHVWRLVARKAGVECPNLTAIAHEDITKAFWQWVEVNPAIPVIITEGAKKTASLLSHGYVAIGLPGIYSGYRSKDAEGNPLIKKELIPQFEPFTQPRREWVFCFDNDSKPSTRKAVRTAIANTCNLLKATKGKVSVMTWRGSAKGIDDVIVAHGEDALDRVFSARQSLDCYQLNQYIDLSPLVSLRVNSRYLGDAVNTLPANKLIGIQSFYATGKTEWLAKQVESFLLSGGKVIIPVHREQLAKELGNRLGLEYRTELTKEGKIFGYALCIDSLHPKAKPPFRAEDWGGCWLILDEADQVIWHSLNSSTCESNRTAIANSLAELANEADKIFLLSADLSKADIDFIQGLLIEPAEPFVIVNDYRPTDRPCIVFEKPQELFAKILERIGADEKIIIHTGGQKDKSKWGTINLEKMLRQQFPDLKILRIDSNSVAEPGHPAFGVMGNLNAVLPLYDIVIASPTIETGISINGDHFDAVFCFASGSQTVDAIGQTLERVRAGVPRYVWATDNACYSLIAGGSTSPYGVIQGMVKLAKLNHSLTQAENYCRLELDTNAIHVKVWGIKAACHNLGFWNYRDAVIDKLSGNGYDVRFMGLTDDTDSIKEMAKAQAQASHDEYCEKVSAAPIIEDPKEYKALKDKRAKTEQERLSEAATAIANKYATDAIDADLVDKDSERGWYVGLRLHYALTVGAEFTKARDQNRITSLAENNGQIFAPDFNKKCLSTKVESLKLLELPKFLDPDRQFTKADPDLVEWHKLCCAHHRDLKTYLNISINANANANRNSPIDCLRKFLKLFALELTEVGRETTGEQFRQYKINTDPDGRGEIFARWLKRDQEKAETPVPPSIGAVEWFWGSTESNMRTLPKSIAQEKDRSFSHITKCTHQSPVIGSIIFDEILGARRRVTAINGATIHTEPETGQGEVAATHRDWCRLIA